MAAEHFHDEPTVFPARVVPPGPLTRRLLPSPLDLLVVGAFVLSLTRPVFTDSVWWRFRIGAWILEHFDVPRSNLYAFTAVQHPWITHSWASDVLLHLIFDRLGPGWLLFARGILLALTVGLLFRLLRRRGGVIPSMLITLASFLVLLPELRVGPLLFAGLLLMVLLTLLEDADWRGGRAIILIPPLFLVWANFHGSFIIGLALLLLHCLGDLRAGARRAAIRDGLGHTVAAVLAVPFTLCNPYYGATYATAFEDLWQLLASVPFRLQVLPWTFLLGAGLGALAATVVVAAAGREVRWRLALPFALLCPIGLLVPGYAYLWVLWAAVTVMEHLEQVAERLRHDRRSYLERMGELPRLMRRVADRFAAWSTFDRFLVRGNYTALAFAVALSLFSIPAGNSVSIAGVSIRGLTLDDILPADLAPRRGTELLLSRVFPDARVMTPAGWGGYILWAGYPALQVFIDDREPAYPLEVEDEYDRFAQAGPGWEEVLDRYQVDYVLWPSSEFQPRGLVGTGRWKELYRDAVCSVLGRSSAPPDDRERLELSTHNAARTLKEQAPGPTPTPTPEPEIGFGMFRPNRSGPAEN